MSSPLSPPSLSHALGAEPPASVLALPEDAHARLAAHVEAASRRQSALVSDAVDAAVKGVPLPVRGVVRKALLA